MHHIPRSIIFTLLVVLAGGAILYGVWGHPYSEAYSIGKNVRDFNELSSRFQKLSEDKGAEYAFNVLRVADLPPGMDLHLLGHVVGDQLYEQKGVSGISLCTQDFRNACSHSIVIGALNEFGSSALPMVRDACRNAPGGPGAYTMCFHGLGHGVFAYYGYSLPETVDFCQTTGTQEYKNREYIECIGGTVMELIGGGGHDPERWLEARVRYLSVSNPIGLCMGSLVPDDARGICLTYITPYLFEAAGMNMGRPDERYFSKAFSFCESIPQNEPALRGACFGGFGKEFIPMAGDRDIRDVSSFTDAQFGRAIEWCRQSPHAEALEACISEAVASVFWGGENDPNAAFSFCNLTNSQEKPACFARLAGDIRSYTDGEVRVQLCSRIPVEQTGLCQ